MRALTLALLPLILLASSAHALPKKLPPVDQCSGDASFAEFLSGLQQAVAKKDKNVLLALLSPDVFVSFDGATGRDEFARHWSFDAEEYGNVWDQIRTMLSLGCSNSENVRLIPSLSDQLDQYGADEVFEMRLILPGAKLFKEPGNEDTAAPIAAWTLATATSEGGDLWAGVRLPDEREGLVPDDKVYEPLGYRMTIEKVKGVWMITAFVAGD